MTQLPLSSIYSESAAKRQAEHDIKAIQLEWAKQLARGHTRYGEKLGSELDGMNHEPDTKTTVHEEQAVRRQLPMPRRLPVLPQQQDAQGPQAEADGK